MTAAKILLICMMIAGLAGSAQAAWLTGDIQSDYYLYQDAGENDRYVFTQSLSGRLAPESWRGWKVDFRGELRDANDPIPGLDDARLTGLSLNGRAGTVDLRLGRFMARAGGFSAIDGMEVSVPTKPLRITLAGGREFYSLYRMETSDLPERTRAALLVEGKFFRRLNWSLDHATRLNDGEVDDQITTLRLRCRRMNSFGWDLRAGYDSKASNLRDFMYGLQYKPMKDLQLNLRYTERRYRIYQESFLSRFELEPTRLISLNSHWTFDADGHWLALGLQHRLRDEGDLDRITLSHGGGHGELGLSLQTGEDFGQVGGWLNVYGTLHRHLEWGASVNFDRWDSAWDAEPTEAWANSVQLNYLLSPIAKVGARIEHYRNGTVDSDIRGLLTFKLQYGL